MTARIQFASLEIAGKIIRVKVMPDLLREKRLRLETRRDMAIANGRQVFQNGKGWL